MLLLPLLYMVTFILILNSFTKGLSDDLKSVVDNDVYAIIFPLLLAIGYVTSSGVFLITTVKDREEKLRYLLNFGGMRSFSYYFGIVVADWCLFMIPTIAFVIVVYILDIEVFTNSIGLFVTTLTLFGLDLINLSNAIGFFFKNVDSAFKNSTIFMMLLGLVFPLVTLLAGGFITYYLDKSGDLTKVIYWITLLISPFNVLQ